MVWCFFFKAPGTTETYTLSLHDALPVFVWACAPGVDGDPVFSALMNGEEPEHGYWAIELEGLKRVSQAYVRNTPVLRTVLTAEDGSAVEIIDFAPRHPKHSRTYRPLAFGRVVRPLQGTPRIRVRLRPSADWGARPAPHTARSEEHTSELQSRRNHVRRPLREKKKRTTKDATTR